MRLDPGRDPARDRRLEWMWVTFGYMLALAYVAALITYQVAAALGAG